MAQTAKISKFVAALMVADAEVEVYGCRELSNVERQKYATAINVRSTLVKTLLQCQVAIVLLEDLAEALAPYTKAHALELKKYE